jgi:hypothetical protein
VAGCDIPERYVALIQQGRYADLGELFAVDAIFQNPLGQVLRGREAIRAFYSGLLSKVQPVPRGARHVWDEKARVCVFELETQMRRNSDGEWVNDPAAPYTISAIDRMEINDEGLIQEMTVYMAPANRWMED